MKITDSIVIDADRARVFAAFCDLENAPGRVSGITKVEILAGPSPMNVGTRWRETRRMLGQEATEEMWATAYEQDASYVVEAESRGAHYRSEYVFTSDGGGTRVDMTFVGVPLTLGARISGLIGALFVGAAKKAMHQDMVDLKEFCEAV